MKNNSRNAPPLIKGALALAGFFLVIWGGFHLWQWYKLRPLEAALDTFTAVRLLPADQLPGVSPFCTPDDRRYSPRQKRPLHR